MSSIGGGSSASRVLVVGDSSLAQLLESGLAQEGFQLISVRDGVEALAFLQIERPDILLLNLELPRLDGIEVCRKIRGNSRLASLPIIVLSDKQESRDPVHVLNAGADDYVVKPFEMDELVARIRAVQRRSGATAVEDVLRAGLIELDPERWTISVAGSPVTLTPKEFGLLRVLLEARGRVLTREYLLDTVWGHGTVHGLDTRTVDVHVWRLRRKLGPAGRYILTVRNVGYRFEIFLEWTNLKPEENSNKGE